MTTDFTPWPEALAAQYRQLGYWQDKTLLDYLQQSAERTPNALALVGDNQQWRYQAMLERIEQLAAGFTELGLGCGDNVVLQLGNVAEFYLCVFRFAAPRHTTDSGAPRSPFSGNSLFLSAQPSQSLPH